MSQPQGGLESHQTARDALDSRVLPMMELSGPSNPLTAPLPDSIKGTTPAERAANRFKVEGNAVITGGTGFIGIAAIRALLEHGLSAVAIFDVLPSIQSAEQALVSLRVDFPNATILVLDIDITDGAKVDAGVHQVARKLGTIEHLLCFAGIVGAEHSVDVSPDAWRRLMDVNLTGGWLVAQAVGKQMIVQQTGGSIIFTSSISGFAVNFPQPQVSYNASKAAVIQMARSLAAEWAKYGIRTNSISPGYMNTILNEGEGLKVGRDIWTSRNPLGRIGEPDELTGAVVLLSSRVGGRYINGHDLTVDGGQSVF